MPARQVLVLEEVAENGYVLHYDTHLARYRDLANEQTLNFSFDSSSVLVILVTSKSPGILNADMRAVYMLKFKTESRGPWYCAKALQAV